MPDKIIDTHIHIWNFEQAEYAWLKNDTSILNRNYNIKELHDERIHAGITEGVLVQAANNYEDTDWMLKVAAQTSWITGVVGWLPLKDPAACATGLENKYGLNSYFKGVRHLIHDEPDAGWLLQESVLESLALLADHHLPYDVVGILPAHIETALAVAGKVPGLKMVFDHLNRPPVGAKEKFGIWGELMSEAAKHENFYVKISGLGTAAKNVNSQTAEAIKPYIEFIFEKFGTDRCMCGGDWPVSLLAGSYTKTWQVYKEVISSLLQEDEADKVFYLNAQRFYNL